MPVALTDNKKTPDGLSDRGQIKSSSKSNNRFLIIKFEAKNLSLVSVDVNQLVSFVDTKKTRPEE